MIKPKFGVFNTNTSGERVDLDFEGAEKFRHNLDIVVSCIEAVFAGEIRDSRGSRKFFPGDVLCKNSYGCLYVTTKDYVNTNYVREEFVRTLSEVLKERLRQEEKWGQQDHHPERWLSILIEEVGEAARSILEGQRASYRDELVQVAAVAVAAIEALDRGKK